MTKRIKQLVELKESREQVTQNLMKYQDKMKALFDKRPKTKISRHVNLCLDGMLEEKTNKNMENLILCGLDPSKFLKSKQTKHSC